MGEGEGRSRVERRKMEQGMECEEEEQGFEWEEEEQRIGREG